MLSATKGFRFTGAAGLIVILLAIIICFFYVPQVPALPEGFTAPIIALEFATSFSDANLLFGDDRLLIHRYNTGHQLDMIFLIAYGAFLGFANISGWYAQRRALSLIGMIAAGIAASADFAENLQLMQLTDALMGNASAPDFWLLRLYVTTKFLMICVSMLCLVPLLWNRGWLGRIFCAACFLLAPSTMLTLSGYYVFSTSMTLLTIIAWICLLVWVLKVRNGLPEVVDGSQESEGAQA